MYFLASSSLAWAGRELTAPAARLRARTANFMTAPWMVLGGIESGRATIYPKNYLAPPRLHVFLSVSTSEIGKRQVTPWHTQPLTAVCGADLSTGLSRTGGRPSMPAGIARIMVDGQCSRASACFHPASAAGSPRRITVVGGARDSSSAFKSEPNPAGYSPMVA